MPKKGRKSIYVRPKRRSRRPSKSWRNSKKYSFIEWLDDLASIPKLEQKQWIKDTLRPKHMLHIFGMYFFPHFIKSQTAPCHLELIREMANRNDSAIIFPRGFAKTTWEKIDTIHDMVYALEPVILYVGATFADAQLHLEHIKTELESNELLVSVYGNLSHSYGKRSYRWNLKRLQTNTGINLVARGRCKGRGVNINGKRPTKIIIDDVEDDQQVRSDDQRAKLHHWLNHVIFPSKDPACGRIKMIGTVLSPLCEVLDFFNKHGGIFKKAIEKGESIWPDVFPLSTLDNIKAKIGTRAFSQEYQNTPINDELSVIKLEWVEKTFYEQPLNPLMLRKVIMMDPQAGSSRGSDYYGICKVGFYPKDVHRYVMSVKTGRASQVDQAALLVKEWQDDPVGVLAVGVECVLTQVAVYQLVMDWKAGKIDLPGVDNIGSRNIPFKKVEPEGKDKIARLQMHEPAIERGEVHLHIGMRKFAENLTAFPVVQHDDDVDSFIYCLDESYKNSSLSIISSSSYNQNRKNKSIAGNVMKKDF